MAKDSHLIQQTILWKFPFSTYFQLHGRAVHIYWAEISSFRYKWRNNKNKKQEQASSGQQWSLFLVTNREGVDTDINLKKYWDVRFKVSAALYARYLSFVTWCCITGYLVTDILISMQSLKTLGNKHQVTQHHIYKQWKIQLYCCENLKTHFNETSWEV